MNTLKTSILLSYISVATASAAIITPALPIIGASFHLSKANLSWIVTLFLLGYMIGQLIYAPLANRFGRLIALRVGFIINLIGIVLCLIAAHEHSFSLLLIGRVITALGAAAGLTCTFILINELLDKERAKQALSYTIVSFTVGIGLSILIGGLVTQYLTWSFVFWILMTHGVLVLFSTWLFQETFKEKKSIHITHIAKHYLHAFSNLKLVCFSLLLSITPVFSYCYSTAAPMIAHTYLHITASHYGFWSILVMCGMFAGGMSAAKLLKHLEPIYLLWLAIGMALLGLVSFILQVALQCHSSLWFFVTATYLYLCASWAYPCASFYASNAIADRASASSSMNFIAMASAVITVCIMGYLPLSIFSAMIIVVLFFILIVTMIALLNYRRI